MVNRIPKKPRVHQVDRNPEQASPQYTKKKLSEEIVGSGKKPCLNTLHVQDNKHTKNLELPIKPNKNQRETSMQKLTKMMGISHSHDINFLEKIQDLRRKVLRRASASTLDSRRNNKRVKKSSKANMKKNSLHSK